MAGPGGREGRGRPQGSVALVKPRVLLLLVFTGLAAALVADPSPDPVVLGWLLLGGVLAVAGANALNNVLDRDRDSLMERTMWRPLPAGTVGPPAAITVGIALVVAGTAALWSQVNAMTAVLTLAGVLYYILVYTVLLKPRTPQNIVVGGIAGAFPPLVGWTAVTGELGVAPALMGLLVILWTPPHFWSLAILYGEDYRRAGVPMMPIVMGEQRTRTWIGVYTALMVVTSDFLIWFFHSVLYIVGVAVLGVVHLWLVAVMLRDADERSTWALFKFSSIYLAALFGLMVADSLLAA